MIVIDVEATGLDVNKCSLVSIGAVDFEHPEDQFYAECRVSEDASIWKEADVIHGFTREQLMDPNKKTESEIVKEFLEWIGKKSEDTIAGHNPSFDRDFLKAATERAGLNWFLAFRTVDLHTVCFAHMIARNVPIPLKNKHSALDSDNVMVYVGIPQEPKPHNALNGAKYEAEAFSRLLKKKNLLPEFAEYPIPNWSEPQY